MPFRDHATLVHGATKRGHLESLDVLVEHGAFVDILDGGENTPLHCAAYHKHIDCVIFLAQKGALLYVTNKERMSAFTYAVKVGHLGTDRYLHRYGGFMHFCIQH